MGGLWARAVGVGAVVAMAFAFPVGPAAAQPSGSFVLSNGTMTVVGDVDLFVQWRQTLYAATEITVVDGTVSASESLPLTGTQYKSTFTGNVDLSVTGDYDADTGKIEATFSLSQTENGTRITGLGKERYSEATENWNGTVRGTVGAAEAPLTFRGRLEIDCRSQSDSGRWDDCSTTQRWTEVVTFTVSGGGGAPSALPGQESKEPLGFLKDVQGPVYVAAPEELELEPAERTWRKITPGKKVKLLEGSTIRTGRGGSAVLKFKTGAFTIVDESTLFTVSPERFSGGDTSIIYGRLIKGLADFFFPPQQAAEQKFEVETKLAVVGIKGTKFSLKVTKRATTITVKKGSVEALHRNGESLTIEAGESVKATTEGFVGGESSAAEAPFEPPKGAKELLVVESLGAVEPSPGASSTFTLDQRTRIVWIRTYHWFGGGALGTIALRGEDGKLYGPWPATGHPGQGGKPKAYWAVAPDVVLPLGTYEVVDSDPSTWSQNAETGGRGMVSVYGNPVR